MEVPVTVRGDVDERAVEQLRRCAQAGDAVAAVLCADGHVGYSQPIGGAVAYPDHISPSGVGYDIACIAAGERILTADGFHVAIEDLFGSHRPVRPDGDGRMGDIRPYLGVVAKGRRPVLRLTLADGRRVRLTGDHEVRATRGWVRCDALTSSDRVLVPGFTGLPFEPCPYTADFLALAGVINGDGHIVASGKHASVFTSVSEDAVAIAAAVERETGGYRPPMYRRVRPNGSTEVQVRINNRELVQRLVAFGCPAGRKRGAWDPALTTNLLELPAWARARYLAGLAAAEATTPRYAARPVNLMIKQAGKDAMDVVQALMESLGFTWATSVIDGMQVGQIVGGAEEQLRFLREVGFAFATGKTAAAAGVAAAALAASTVRLDREAVRARMRAACDAGATVRQAAAAIAAETGLTEATCIHLLYRRGTLRVPRGYVGAPAVHGDCCWVAVRAVEPDGDADTFDLVTGDPEHAFVASGITVHNCGNKAVRTDLLTADVRGDLPRIMDTVFERISFGVGRRNDEPVDHAVLDEIARADFAPQRRLHALAAKQLGTVGAGNHYVDLFDGDDGHVWVGVHFGSRGFGHKTASGFLALAAGRQFDERLAGGEMDAPPVLLHVDSELGRSYIAAMELAGKYAYAGRDVVVDRVLEILGARSTYEVHNHHNFAWRERHHGTDVWVIRKGCTPAFPGQEGFVGATMGEPSVILRGTDAPQNADLLFSTVHGAGRVMSRRQAAGKRRRGKVVKPGLIDYAAVRRELTGRGIELRGGAADEAPDAYKRLDAVLAAHGDTVEVLHRLTPIGVAMAGADTFDPYKD